MPKFVRPAHVSIVIPLQRDEKRFEATLLSVLENRPEDCQIIAVHNGTYSDPFALGDELTLVTARSSNLVDLIRDAYDAVDAPIVHVLGTGIRATENWLDGAIDLLEEQQVAAVCPTYCDDAFEVTGSSLWADGRGQLRQPAHRSKRPNSLAPVRGFALNAFTIRRRLLGELLEAVAPAMNDPVAVSYAFGCLLKRGGWKVSVAQGDRVIDEGAMDCSDESDFARGQCLGAIRQRILPETPALKAHEMLQEALLGDSTLAEMLGMLRCRGTLSAMRRAIDPESVSGVDDLARILELETVQDRPLRNAA